MCAACVHCLPTRAALAPLTCSGGSQRHHHSPATPRNVLRVSTGAQGADRRLTNAHRHQFRSNSTGSNRLQPEQARDLGRTLDIATSECTSNVVQLVCILRRQIWAPPPGRRGGATHAEGAPP